MPPIYAASTTVLLSYQHRSALHARTMAVQLNHASTYTEAAQQYDRDRHRVYRYLIDIIEAVKHASCSSSRTHTLSTLSTHTH